MPMTFPDGGRSELQEDFQDEDNLNQVKHGSEGDFGGYSSITPAPAEPLEKVEGETPKEPELVEQVATEHEAVEGDGNGDSPEAADEERASQHDDRSKHRANLKVEDQEWLKRFYAGECGATDASEEVDATEDSEAAHEVVASESKRIGSWRIGRRTRPRRRRRLSGEGAAAVAAADAAAAAADMADAKQAERRRLAESGEGAAAVAAADAAAAAADMADAAEAAKQAERRRLAEMVSMVSMMSMDENERRRRENVLKSEYFADHRIAGDKALVSPFLPQDEQYYSIDLDVVVEPDDEEELYNPNKVLIGRIALKCLRVVYQSTKDEDDVLDTIYKMSIDESRYVRTDLMEYVPYMALFCASKKMWNITQGYLVPWVVDRLSDPVHVVRKAAQIALLVLFDRYYIPMEMIEEKVCPAVLQLPFDDEVHLELDGSSKDRVDFMAGTIKIMCSVAQRLGPKKAEDLFLKKFCSLAKHSSRHVRQVCASQFIDFAMVVLQSTVQNVLLPLLIGMCDDTDIMVRRACSVIVLSLSCLVPMEARRNILTPAFIKLLYDTEGSVQNEAFCSLGPFITTFAEPSMVNLVYEDVGLVLKTKTSYYRLNGCDIEEHYLVNASSGIFHPRDLINLRSYSFPEVDISLSNRPAPRLSVSQVHEDDFTGPSHVSFSDGGGVGEESSFSFNSFQYWREPISEHYLDLPLPELSRESAGHVEQISLDETRRNVSPRQVFKSRDPLSRLRRNKPVQNVVPDELLEAFISMTFPKAPPVCGYCTDYTLLCAHNFPAVAWTLGRANWACLRKTHQRLSQDSDPNVRRTVAASLHVMASLVGEVEASRDLVPMFHWMMGDDDKVKIAAMRVAPQFFQELPEKIRLEFLPRLMEFSPLYDDSNGRLREEWAQQIQALLKLYERGDVAKYLQPLALQLLRDRVSGVRQCAMNLVGELLQTLETRSESGTTPSESPTSEKRYSPHWIELFDQLVVEFAFSARWERRQIFALLCHNFFAHEFRPCEKFAQNALPILYQLSDDEVVNVRIAVAKALSAILREYERSKPALAIDPYELAEVLNVMRNDKDFDVRYCASSEEADQ